MSLQHKPLNRTCLVLHKAVNFRHSGKTSNAQTNEKTIVDSEKTKSGQVMNGNDELPDRQDIYEFPVSPGSKKKQTSAKPSRNNRNKVFILVILLKISFFSPPSRLYVSDPVKLV